MAGAIADGVHNHGGNHRNGRRGGRRLNNAGFRRGRQEDLAAPAPLAQYGAQAPPPPPPVAPATADYQDYQDYQDPAPGAQAPLGSYGSSANVAPVVNGNGGSRANGNGGAAAAGGDDNLAMLEKAVPGVPGEDYPIFAEVPESSFSCDGQVDGGIHRESYQTFSFF